MNWIDTHTHLYLQEFDKDREDVMKRSIDIGVRKMLLPNIDSMSIFSMYEIKDKFPDNIDLMMGLHPCSVMDNYLEEIKIIENELSQNKFIGIGEIGIDLYWDALTFENQKKVFKLQLQWAKELNLPVSIHSREATKEVIDCLNEMNGGVKGVFHCFSGNIAQAREVVELGMFLGIGGVVTYKKTNLPEIITELGLEHIVLETDAPYLSPIPYRGTRNESSYIPIIGERIANILGLGLQSVLEATWRNSVKVFFNS
ncbi:MAG: TatD family hydrolase [Saprospiraceae bacterium]